MRRFSKKFLARALSMENFKIWRNFEMLLKVYVVCQTYLKIVQKLFTWKTMFQKSKYKQEHS